MAASPTTRVELLFRARCGRAPEGVVFAPGRVVLLGEHLDHQGGSVLAAPLPQGVACAWGVRPDTRVVVWAMNARAKDSFHQGAFVRSGRAWADLARGACARVAAGGRRLPGIDLVVLGDLPAGEGLASSAAYVVAILRALHASVGEYRSRWELSEDVPWVEREWIGVACGALDPYVVAAARPGQVLHLACGGLQHEVLHLPADVELVAEPTGVRRALRDTPYNERRGELAEALAAVRAAGSDVVSLCDLTPEAFAALAPSIPEPGRRRARHVVTESERVRRAAQALRADDPAAVGALMVAGHASLRDDFESSLPAIDAQVKALCASPGVLGARLQGAGWGGRIAVLRRRGD
jgi:galactokinase